MAKTSGAILDELPFAVFLWVACADGDVGPREAETFQKLAASRSWCRSDWTEAALATVDESYSALWKRYTGSEYIVDVRRLRDGYAALAKLLGGFEYARAAEDLAHVADAVARAAGGLFGIGSVSRTERSLLAMLDVIAQEQMPRDDGLEGTARPTETQVWGGEKFTARCVQVIEETHDCKTFRFAAELPMHFRYAPGQFMSLQVEVDGKVVRRSYTISSSPTRPDTLEVTVKRVPGGVVSNWLCDNMKVGDPLTITGCAGHFTCSRSAAESFLMISAGSGITPVMSMSRWLFDRGDARDVVFVHSARTPRDLIFADELRLLERRHPSFRLALTLTRQAPDDWQGYRGRVSAPLLEEIASDWRERHIFLCGPEPFMAAVKESVEEAGYPMAHYAAESFGSSPQRAERASGRVARNSLVNMLPPPIVAPKDSMRAPRPKAGSLPRQAARSAAPAITFQAGGERFELHDEETTVLEAAEMVGVDIPNACRTGVCGSCRVRVEGKAVMASADALSEDEVAEGWVLACVARAEGALNVVVDS